MRIFIYILYFILFFVVFYLEGQPNDGVLSLRQIWKIPLIIFLIYHLLFINTVKQPVFCKINNWYSVKNFINTQYFSNLLFCISEFSKQIIFSLFYSFFAYIFSNRLKDLEKLMIYISQFIALSSIPVLLGIITPNEEYRLLDSFGIEGTYYSGIFGAYHIASYYFCISFLILVFLLKNNVFKEKTMKIYNLFLASVSLYSLFLTYVRTGWIMCLFGVAILFFPRQKEFKKLLSYSVGIIAVLMSTFYFYKTNEAFNARIAGVNIYLEKENIPIDLTGSGRTLFWKNGIELWSEGNIFNLLFGQGYDAVTQRNFEQTGMRVFSHNQFIDTLSQNGLIGFILLILFYISLYKFLIKYKEHFYFPLGMVGLGIMFIYSFFQGSFPFLICILMPIILLLTQDKKSKEYNYG